ncbi:MAG: hypothetical protein Q4D21_09930 [Phascolarctobacterium sp.]|nr:hypothetical protein [Phascolarctobacterium sp.]
MEMLETSSHIDTKDGMHVIFGMVVVPYLVHLLDLGDKDKLKRAFEYFEKMASSGDILICEVLEFTILEDLISRGAKNLELAKKFMQHETLESCLKVEKYML